MKQSARIQRQPAARVTLTLDYVRQVKARHEAALLRKANVVSVGIGLAPITPAPGSPAEPPSAPPTAPRAAPPMANSDTARCPVLVVGVRRAVALDPDADPDSDDDGIPDQIEGVPVTVQVAGDIHAL